MYKLTVTLTVNKLKLLTAIHIIFITAICYYTEVQLVLTKRQIT